MTDITIDTNLLFYVSMIYIGSSGFKYHESEVIPMLESVERKSRTSELPYDMVEEDVTTGLMKLSELSLHDFLSSEPDIYTDKDLKVRYR